MKCPSCSNDVLTTYCPHCGQRQNVSRITLKETVRDFWMQVVGFDGFFLRTLHDLTLRPGQVARSYIDGVRVRYFGPLAYFFFMITLLLLWLSVLGLDFSELIRDKQQTLAVPNASNRAGALVTQWIGDHIKWVLFLAVPFQAFGARHFWFRKSGLNLVEHMVPLFYISGHLFWVTMLVFAYRKIMGDIPVVAVTLLSVMYFGYMYANLMTYQSRLKAFLKGFGVYVTGQLLFVVTLTVIAIILLLLIMVFSPETLESVRPQLRNP